MDPRGALLDALGEGFGASDGLIATFDQFVSLVQKWNPAINMIGKSTEAQIWDRHICDSAQLFKFATPGQLLWLDIGSGGGFPGLVLAILAREFLPDLRFALVESDKRKAVFLSEAARLLGLQVVVHALRIENLKPQKADVVSARALAPLSQLCEYAERHIKPDGICVFPKGAMAAAELVEAKKRWRFGLDRAPSNTDSMASVLCLRGLRRV